MSSIYIQDTFEPYYAGRKNPKPPASPSEAERKESARKLAERAKQSEVLRSAENIKES